MNKEREDTFMGLFDFLFKSNTQPKSNSTSSSPASVPTMRDGTPKQYDYFVFKLKDSPQEVLATMKPGLFVKEEVDVTVKIGERDGKECVVAYYKGQVIGYGDSQALKKIKEHHNQKLAIHSRSIHSTKDNKLYCRIRMIYYY